MRVSLKSKLFFAALAVLGLAYLVAKVDIAYTTRSAESAPPPGPPAAEAAP